jgi:hypothetical protein
MKSARLPTACTSSNSLTRQWNKALSDIDRLEKEPTITWPDAERPTVPAGKSLIVYAISYFQDKPRAASQSLYSISTSFSLH